MITVKAKGKWSKTRKLLQKAEKMDIHSVLKKYAEAGCYALAAKTPKDTGKTALSWGYEVQTSNKEARIIWTNSNTNDGVNIAILLQYGHGTKGGGYVQGRDYINPALRPIFDALAEEAWKEVTST